MARRVTREYVDQGDDYVAQDRRPLFWFNPISAIIGVILLALLLWAIFFGPIGELFDGDGEGPNITVDKPTLNQ